MKALKLAGIALMLTAAVAQATPQGVVLKFTPKKGDVTKLMIKGNLQFGGMDITAELHTVTTVKEVAEDGSFTMEEKQMGGKASVGGQDIDIPETPASTTLHNPDGSVKEIRGDDVGPGQYRVAQLQGFFPPKDAVKVGSKWTNEIKANADKGTVAVKGEYEIVGEETVDGQDVFIVKSKLSETEGSDPATIEGKTWISKKTADLVKAEQKWINVPMSGAPGPISGSFVITREK